MRACLSPLLSSSCSRPSPGDCGCSCWGWGGEGCSPARVSLASFLPEGSPLSVPSALGGCGLCGAEPGASPSREQLGDTPRGCMGTAGEDRTAAGNGLNASLAALSCAVEGTPLLGHFWNPTGLFAGGKKESLAALRNVAVSVLSSSVFFFFFGMCVWCYCLCPRVVVGRIKGCRVSVVPDPIKINASKWDIKGSRRWHPGRGTTALGLVKGRG